VAPDVLIIGICKYGTCAWTITLNLNYRANLTEDESVQSQAVVGFQLNANSPFRGKATNVLVAGSSQNETTVSTTTSVTLSNEFSPTTAIFESTIRQGSGIENLATPAVPIACKVTRYHPSVAPGGQPVPTNCI
jgi:hypothetical protein